MNWERAVTDPLGLAGFALALVFTLVTRLISRQHKEQYRWLVPAAYGLAVACIVAGFSLAWHRDTAAAKPPTPVVTAPAPQPAPAPSVTQSPTIITGDINQTGDGNIAAVQDNATTSTRPKKAHAKSKPAPLP